MYCVDTTFLIDLLREEDDATAFAEDIALSDVLVTSITLYEAYLGEKLLEKDLSDVKEFEQDVQVIQFSERYAEEAADIQKQLLDDGERIPALDVLIAGIARKEDAVVVTEDTEHFERIEGLDVVDYHR